MSPPPEDTAVRVASSSVSVRRHALASWLTAAAILVLIGGSGLGAAVGSVAVVLLGALLPSLALLAAAARASNGPPGGAGSVAISPSHVTVERDGAAWSVDRRDVTGAWVVRGERATRVEFQRSNGDVITAAVAGDDEAHAALAAAGLDARQRAVRVVLGSRWDGLGLGLAATLFALLQATPVYLLFMLFVRVPLPIAAAVGAALLAAVCGVAARTLGPAELTVGSDGVSWRRGFSKGFVAYKDVAAVEVLHGSDVVLRRRTGEREVLQHSRRDPARAEGVADLVRAAMRRAHVGSAAAVELLDRNGRSLDDWRAALRALAKASAYRDVTLSRDDIARALDDPDSAPERRVGAALALAATGDPEAVTRIRVAADACASDAVRGALEDVLRDELDEPSLASARAARHARGR